METAKVAKNLKTEIERRTRDTSKLIELEAQKLAVGEMVCERLDQILDLLRAAGFKARALKPQQPLPQAAPPHTTIVQASQLAPEAPPAAVKNPCYECGREAAFDEDMPDGSKKYYCRPHGQARAKAKAEENQTNALFGNSGTMFARPQNPAAKPAQKMIIQADADPLKGPFPNGIQPPTNPVLDDD